MPICPICKANHDPDVPCYALHEQSLKDMGVKSASKDKKGISPSDRPLRLVLIIAVVLFVSAVILAFVIF